jgi:hypothetical protein
VSPNRSRFTIRAIMIAVAVVAIVLAIGLQVPRDVLFGNHRWLAFGPLLLFLVPRLLILSWARRAREDQEVRNPPPL